MLREGLKKNWEKAVRLTAWVDLKKLDCNNGLYFEQRKLQSYQNICKHIGRKMRCSLQYLSRNASFNVFTHVTHFD